MKKQKQTKIDQVLEQLGEHSRKFDRIFNILDKHSLKFLEQDDKFVKMDAKIDDKFDQVLTSQDKIVGILETIRQEQTIAKGKDKTQDQRLDKLELAAGFRNA